MKPLVKKLIESGIIDKHAVQMMEKWGSGVDPGASDLVGNKQVHEETLTQFAEEIEEMIDNERGQVKETRLDISAKAPPSVFSSAKAGLFAAIPDEFDRLIVSPDLEFIPG